MIYLTYQEVMMEISFDPTNLLYLLPADSAAFTVYSPFAGGSVGDLVLSRVATRYLLSIASCMEKTLSFLRSRNELRSASRIPLLRASPIVRIRPDKKHNTNHIHVTEHTNKT